jgi:hypothetical protein
VNGADTTWLRDYTKVTGTHIPSVVRYRPWGTLKYLLRGVERYMPFIRNVVLIVAYPTQVPVWLNTSKVKVVYHKDFIPKRYLPTFNSCVIESFFWNIQGIADRVIYFNDDMFPIGAMGELDFFTDNIPHIRFKDPISYSNKNIFESQSRAGMDMIANALGKPLYDKGKLLLPYHISQAITRRGMDRVKEMCSDAIHLSISPIRTVKNVNQYIYAYYQYYTDDYINLTVNYKYFEITESSLDRIKHEIINGDYQMMCLNDSDKIKDYSKVRNRLCDAFETKFPKKCRYEM